MDASEEINKQRSFVRRSGASYITMYRSNTN